jgi:hypothetical protein
MLECIRSALGFDIALWRAMEGAIKELEEVLGGRMSRAQ